jgi:uncharacterized protein (TIGR03083 family)
MTDDGLVPAAGGVVVREALAAESARLTAALREVDPDGWAAPTPCPPWSVADLLAHVAMAVGQVERMLDAPAPPAAEVSAAGYYRPDHRFTVEVNARRIDTAQELAGRLDGRALTDRFERTWRDTVNRCAGEPADRVVLTRHGDPMLLTDYLVTRVVEVGVHGLDLAAGLGREPWLTGPAADLLVALLTDGRGAPLGWDRLTFIGKATGRLPLSDEERAEVDLHGIRWLALG